MTAAVSVWHYLVGFNDSYNDIQIFVLVRMTRIPYDHACDRGRGPSGPATLRTIRRSVCRLFRAPCPEGCRESLLGRTPQRQRAEVHAGDAWALERRGNLPGAAAFHHGLAVATWTDVGAAARADAGTTRHPGRRRHRLSETRAAFRGRHAAILRRARQDGQLPSGRHHRVDRRDAGLAPQLRTVLAAGVGGGRRATRRDACAVDGALSREMADRPGARPRGDEGRLRHRRGRGGRGLRNDHGVSYGPGADRAALCGRGPRPAEGVGPRSHDLAAPRSDGTDAARWCVATRHLGPRDHGPARGTLRRSPRPPAPRSRRSVGALRTVAGHRRAEVRRPQP